MHHLKQHLLQSLVSDKKCNEGRKEQPEHLKATVSFSQGKVTNLNKIGKRIFVSSLAEKVKNFIGKSTVVNER